jgi:hypothetical protein
VIAEAQGWSDFGWSLGAMYSITSVVWGLLVWAVSSSIGTAIGGPIGTAIGTVVALVIVGIDALLAWVFDIKWMDELLEDTYRTRCFVELDIDFWKQETTINDEDNNGIDVGDTLRFEGQWAEWVRFDPATNPVHWDSGDIEASAIEAWYRAVVPADAADVVSDGHRGRYPYNPTPGGSWARKMNTASSTIEVVPKTAMINLPIELRFGYSYGIAYWTQYWDLWSWGEKWEWNYDEGNREDRVALLYLDVLPGTVDDFINWTAITALDSDRDGLTNAEEVTFGSNPYVTDSDADGLSDNFEELIGTNPLSPDSDSDNLSDGYEVMNTGTDPRSEDSDSDNLTDFEEFRGWFIALDYGNRQDPFVAHVWSDPHVNDTDGDGLADREEYELGFNPASKDTDGDGVEDKDDVATTVDIQSILERDLDQDGLTGQVELNGWDVTYTDTTGNHTIHVTSDPFIADTDLDGLSDGEEFDLYIPSPYRTNPRNADTDNDGLLDIDEKLGSYNKYGARTYPHHFDSDGDGLSDFLEFSFGGDPRDPDTDGDGLSDFEEFNLNSHLNNRDTDYDGLTDYFEERDFGTDLLIPDSDTDGLMDGEEYNLGTDPRNPDTDGDTLSDGYEFSIGTDPTNEDTDGEGLKDNEELELRTDPLVTDSDGDGLTDFEEVGYGTSPIIGDTDNDGTTDDLDEDTYATFDDTVIVLYDTLDAGTLQFIEGLGQYTTVESGNWSYLPVDNITGERYLPEGCIVMIGEPVEDEDRPVGYWMDYWIEKFLGAEHLERMLESDSYRFAWISRWVGGAGGPPAPLPDNQVIIMLTSPYSTDHWRTLSMLKHLKVEVTENQASMNYPGTQDSFVFGATDRVGRGTDR